MNRPFFALAFTFLAVLSRGVAIEIEPIGLGPYEVASTNLEVAPRGGLPMFDYLNGKVTGAGTIYLTDILAHPDAVPTLWITVPSDPAVYGTEAGKRIPLLLVVMYPTRKDNPRPGYAFPYKDTGDRLFPHMQRPGEKPIFTEASAKYPLVVNSGGYNTHTLWHMEHLKMLASHGYIAVDILHGDGRGSSVLANHALRTIEFRAATDFILNDPAFGPAIDVARIGAAGQSAGGHTILAAMGGVDPSGRLPDGYDARIKAGFGLVPFMGGSFGIWPFKFDAWYFGEDYSGLRTVRVPFFAVYGEKDSNVLPRSVEAGVRAMRGPATAVMLDGETHNLSNAAGSDIYTWEILFFDAWLRGDPNARRLLDSGTSVRGGVDDHRTIVHGPQ